MSDHLTQSTSPRRARRPRASHIAVAGTALLVLGAILLAGRQQIGHASTPKIDIVYVSVTGEGPAARAWYDGAPSPGLPVQEALSRFAKQGYKVAETTVDLRSTVEVDAAAFVILLQREQ